MRGNDRSLVWLLSRGRNKLVIDVRRDVQGRCMNLSVGSSPESVQPFASLKAGCHTVLSPKLVPLESAQLSPALPRLHTSALPSPLTSGNLIVL